MRPVAGVRTLFAVALIVALGTAPARASEPELFGLGARSSALAGLGAADAEGYEATYLNPAGLIGPKRRRLTLGYIGARMALRLDGRDHPTENADGLLIGVALPLGFGGVLTDRLALGLGFYLPTNVLNRARQPFPDEPRLALLATRLQTVSILVGAGARLHARVTLGIGLLALATLGGRIVLVADAAGVISTQSEQQLKATYAPVVGLRVQAHRTLQLGLALRGESRSRYDIAVESSLGDAIPLQLPTIRIAGTSQFDPLQLALEAAWQVAAPVKLLVGVTWKHWSAFDSPVARATLGAPPPPEPGFRDTAVPRIGLEVGGGKGALRVDGRLGYFYEPTPAPVNPSTIYVDADRHATTMGLGLSYSGRSLSGRIDGFGQLHVLAGNPRATGLLTSFGVTLGVDL